MIARILLVLLFTLAACTVTVKEIKNVTGSKQLLFAGNMSVPASSDSNLFFLFYGVQGVTDRTQLANTPTLVVFGSPSGSSQYLNFAGLGPLVFNTSTAALTNNTNTASAYANLLFVDFLGAGFSFASDVKQIASDYATLAKQVSFGLNDFASTVDFGKGKWVLVGESSWLRTVPSYNLQNVVAVVSMSSWPELNAIGKYYGVAGLELKLFNANEKTLVETNFVQCYTNIKNGKYREAHNCSDNLLDLIESKANDHNLYNVNNNTSLLPHFAIVENYLSNPAIVTLFSAPTSQTFERQTSLLQANTYVDEAKNYTKPLSDFLTSNPKTKMLFIGGDLDFVAYSKSVSNWTQTDLSFPESADYAKAQWTNITVNGTVAARTRQVTQVQFVEVLSAGHYLLQDKPLVVSTLLQSFVQQFKNEERDSHLRFEEQIII